jgi:L-fuculose-phosphate aldolase
MSHELRAEICKITRLLWERELIGTLEGNVSCRIEDGLILATPKGKSKCELAPDDIVALDLDGAPHGLGTPSSEIKMHLRLYRERPDCNAIVHAHPIFATGLATAGRTVPDDVLPEAGYFLGSVALVRFARPGTDDVGDAIAEHAQAHKTFLLQQHGAVTLGATLMDAYDRMETLERVSRVMFVAEAFGGAKRLEPQHLEWLRSVGLSPKL